MDLNICFQENGPTPRSFLYQVVLQNAKIHLLLKLQFLSEPLKILNFAIFKGSLAEVAFSE